MNMEDQEAAALATGLKKLLDRHGHGFQFSVVEKAKKLSDQPFSGMKWIFETVEFPVENKGQNTRIDILLRNREQPIYLVAECKRANPSLGAWCFVQAPYIHRNFHSPHLIIEHVRFAEEVTTSGVVPAYSNNVYDLGLEVKTKTKGDSGGEGRNAIEDAATQVLRGVNGFVEFLSRHPAVVPEQRFQEQGAKQAWICPVIFTTAEIWTSPVKLSEADLHTGIIENGRVHLERQPWIWYRYHQSPMLKHAQKCYESPTDISEALNKEYARTIAIVSSDGIEPFLVAQLF